MGGQAVDTRGDAAWTDPTRPPRWAVETVQISHDVWAVWLNDLDAEHPHLWHWCTQSKWIAEGRQLARPGWMLAGTGAHTVHCRDPLHLEPSILWYDCCGMHGWIRDGRWVAA